MDPQLMELMQLLLYGNGGMGQNYMGEQYGVPNFNTFGGPMGLEPANDDGSPDYNANLTAASKVRSGYADMVTAALSGPGAFGPGQFENQVEYTDITDQTPWNNANAYLGGGGIEGLTARQAQTGALPTEITGYIKTLQALEPGTDDYEARKADYAAGGGDPAEFDADWSAVQSSAPMYTSDIGEDGLDQGALQSTVQSVWDQMRQADQYFNNLYDPETNPTGLYENQGGVLRQREEVPSQAMEWFDDKGLSYPDQQYDYDYFLQNSPELQAAEGRMETAPAELEAMLRSIYQTKRTPTVMDEPTPVQTQADYIAPTQSSTVDPRAPEQWGGGAGPGQDYQAGASSAVLDRLAADGNASQMDASGLSETELNSARADGIRGGVSDDFIELGKTLRETTGQEPGGGSSDPIGSFSQQERGMPNAGWNGPRQLVNYDSPDSRGWNTVQRNDDKRAYVGAMRQNMRDRNDQFAARGQALNLQNAGRTPLGDELQRRAMQLFMSGAVPGY